MQNMEKYMNKGTRIRAAIALIALINQALVTIGTVDFGNEISNQIYKWISLLFLVGAMVTSHWYNNDYTPIASEYTGAMRQAKTGDEAGVDVSGLDYLEDGDDDEDL